MIIKLTWKAIIAYGIVSAIIIVWDYYVYKEHDKEMRARQGI